MGTEMAKEKMEKIMAMMNAMIMEMEKERVTEMKIAIIKTEIEMEETEKEIITEMKIVMTKMKIAMIMAMERMDIITEMKIAMTKTEMAMETITEMEMMNATIMVIIKTEIE